MQENKQEHFIKNIEIKNFKCFEDFKAEGFGRVNLIGGKNNVGKTAFMEALQIFSFHAGIKQISAKLYLEILICVFKLRNYEKNFTALDVFKSLTPMEIKDKANELRLFLKEDGFKNIVQIQDKEYILDDKNINDNSFLGTFISSFYILDEYLESGYNRILEKRKRDDLNQILNTFDANIEEFEIINNVPKIFLKKEKEFVDLQTLGHGIKRYVAIIIAILVNEKDIVFLDEIENGIHYTKFDEMWSIILTISKQQNVQVFATTHSKECIESYARVAKELEDNEITFFKLGHNKKGELKGMVYPYDWFVDSVEQEQELRGW